MTRLIALTATCVLALALVACDDDDTEDEAQAPPAPGALTILVTNDDGVDNEGDNTGIDALVEGLRTLPDVELVVVTAAEDRTGSGSRTSEPPFTVTESATESGFPAVEVDGYPADAVTWALDGGIDITPDLVVSGINPGPNAGPISEVSGTVGAALTAAAAGVPSLAVSVGLTEEYDYSFALDLTLEWIEDHREAIVSGELIVETVSINVPSCPDIRGVVEVPVNVEDYEILDVLEVDCDSKLTDPADDVEGFVNGFAVISVVPPLDD